MQRDPGHTTLCCSHCSLIFFHKIRFFFFLNKVLEDRAEPHHIPGACGACPRDSEGSVWREDEAKATAECTLGATAARVVEKCSSGYVVALSPRAQSTGTGPFWREAGDCGLSPPLQGPRPLLGPVSFCCFPWETVLSKLSLWQGSSILC